MRSDCFELVAGEVLEGLLPFVFVTPNLERYVHDGSSQHRLARLHIEVVLHEGQLEDVTCEGEHRHGSPADPSISPEEPVGEWITEVIFSHGDHLDLFSHDVLLRVGVVTHVHEVVQQRRNSLIDLRIHNYTYDEDEF